MDWAATEISSPEIEIRYGLEYGRGGGRPLLLDLALPATRPAENLPAVVFIHGGGWKSADRSNGTPLIALLARHGFVAASIDYRLSTEAAFPAQLEDSKCAVRFLRAHAAEFNIDPSRIGTAGGSAGGHLAALVGLVPESAGLEGSGGWENQPSGVIAVADLYGISDVARLVEEGPASECALLLMRGTPSEHPELYRQASPMAWVRSQPPAFYLAHGEADASIPPDHSERLAQALREAGGEVQLRLIPGMGHGSIATLPEVVRSDVAAFFQARLARAMQLRS